MNLILALIVGGVIGWLASIVMRTDAQQGIFLNIIVGIVGNRFEDAGVVDQNVHRAEFGECGFP